MEQNILSFNPQLQRYSNESNALSINSNAEIEEPKDDEFFDAAKKNVIKKLELELLKDELDSAEYQKDYPYLDNIYDILNDPFNSDLLGSTPDTPTDILEKIKIKENEKNASQKEYSEKKVLDTNKDSHSNIILYNETLDGYISNKEDLRTIIKNIDKEVKKGIPLNEKLRDIENSDLISKQTTTVKEKITNIKQSWEPIFISYNVINENLRKLFNSINDELLDINDKFYIKLSSLKLFNINQLFDKTIYDSNDLRDLFDTLYNNVFKILKDYTRYNEFVKSKTNQRGSAPVIYRMKKEADELTQEILRLRSVVAQLNRNSALPDRGKRRHLKKIKQLTKEDKKRLTQKMNEQIRGLQERKDAEIRKLNEEIQELRSRQNIQDTNESKSTESHDIEELNRTTQALIVTLETRIAELSRLQKLLNSPEELQILESQNTGFLRLVIDAAYVYGKIEENPEEKEKFKDSFKQLLDYRPDNKFMFADVFAKMEQGQGNKELLEKFLQNLDKIPEDLFKDQLISEITNKITIPIPQTR
jgi:hypothetical protein